MPKGTTQISHGSRTKCRKTRAMLTYFAILVCLSLKQLRHFYASRCLFAKIAIPSTIYILLFIPSTFRRKAPSNAATGQPATALCIR